MFFKPLHNNKIEIHLKVYTTSKVSKLGKCICIDNKNYLVVRVSQIPEDNKANIAIINIISKFLCIAKSNICIIKGTKSRYKTVILKNITPLYLKSKILPYIKTE